MYFFQFSIPEGKRKELAQNAEGDDVLVEALVMAPSIEDAFDALTRQCEKDGEALPDLNLFEVTTLNSYNTCKVLGTRTVYAEEQDEPSAASAA